jgi:hypothetical protein
MEYRVYCCILNIHLPGFSPEAFPKIRVSDTGASFRTFPHESSFGIYLANSITTYFTAVPGVVIIAPPVSSGLILERNIPFLP